MYRRFVDITESQLGLDTSIRRFAIDQIITIMGLILMARAFRFVSMVVGPVFDIGFVVSNRILDVAERIVLSVPVSIRHDECWVGWTTNGTHMLAGPFNRITGRALFDALTASRTATDVYMVSEAK